MRPPTEMIATALAFPTIPLTTIPSPGGEGGGGGGVPGGGGRPTPGGGGGGNVPGGSGNGGGGNVVEGGGGGGVPPDGPPPGIGARTSGTKGSTRPVGPDGTTRGGAIWGTAGAGTGAAA